MLKPIVQFCLVLRLSWVFQTGRTIYPNFRTLFPLLFLKAPLLPWKVLGKRPSCNGKAILRTSISPSDNWQLHIYSMYWIFCWPSPVFNITLQIAMSSILLLGISMSSILLLGISMSSILLFVNIPYFICQHGGRNRFHALFHRLSNDLDCSQQIIKVPMKHAPLICMTT